mmetsp:Transcript_34673/g.102923  ORF Transcript_34673/g.102923 Transcript_34673/m.102923 type:complete len:80 (+) Transcript_34673:547-786(+)|eukprot:356135-Chlamydomonas_euryale.AAC.6
MTCRFEVLSSDAAGSAYQLAPPWTDGRVPACVNGVDAAACVDAPDGHMHVPHVAQHAKAWLPPDGPAACPHLGPAACPH